MNKKIILLIVLLAIAGVAIWLFLKLSKGADTAYRSVPAGSTLVYTLDLKSLSEKAKLSEFKDSKLWELIKDKESKDLVSNLTNDPLSTGINFLNPVVGFVETGKRKISTGIVMSLMNKADFAATLKKINDKIEIKTASGYDYVSLENDMAVGWNDKNAVIYFHHSKQGTLERLDSLINHKIDNISKKDAFKKFLDKSSDISLFINYGKVNEESRETLAQTGLTVPDYYILGYVSFLDGKIEMTAENYFESKEDKEKMNFMSSENASDVLPFLSAEKPVMFMNVKMDFEKLFNYLMESPQIASSLGEVAESMDIERASLKDLLSGEVALSFSGVQKNTVESTDFMGTPTTREETVPRIGLFLGIKDKALAAKIMTKIGLPKNADGYYQIPLPLMSLNMVETEKGFVLNMNPADAKKLVTDGKLSASGFGELSKFSTSYSFTAYADLNPDNLDTSTKEALSSSLDPDGYDIFREAMAPFSVIRSWNTSSTETVAEVTFKDASSNSLYQVLKMLEKVGIKTMDREKAQEEKFQQMYEEDLREEDVVIEEQEVIN